MRPDSRSGPTHPVEAFPREALAGSIPDRFEAIVRRYPDRLAVKTGPHALTYDALNQTANRLANLLLAERGRKQEAIALLLPRNAALYAAIMGLLKAGKIYVALEPAFPSAQLRSMVEDSEAALIVTNTPFARLARTVSGDASRLLDLDALDLGLPAENPGLSLGPEATAYIMYTSGSTGRPKGVVVSHRYVTHVVLSDTNALGIAADDRLSLLYSPGSTGSLTGIFGALLNGGASFPFDLQAEGLHHLADWLVREEITIFKSVTTIFRRFAESLTGGEQFPRLRLVHVGGETVTHRDVDLFKVRFPATCRLVVRLSSTETGIVCYYPVNPATPVQAHVVPVGYPVADKEVLLLDDAGNLVGPDQIGEIAVKSRYLADGYWRQPEHTRATFLADPEGGDVRTYRTGDLGRLRPDGCLEHLGRKDFRVRVRGRTVDVAAIEAALLAVDNVKDVAVMAREDRPGDERIVAYVAPERRPGPTATALRHSLARILQDYMVPSTYVVLDALPQTSSGKVDRRALPPPDGVRPDLDSAFVAPRTPLEKHVAAIWADTLGLDRVGIADSFLNLGGHSLLAGRIVARVLATLRVDLPPSVLLEAPTVAAMAKAVVQRQAEAAGAAGEIALAELEALPEEEAARLLAKAALRGEAREGQA